jgi:hypothetical protein
VLLLEDCHVVAPLAMTRLFVCKYHLGNTFYINRCVKFVFNDRITGEYLARISI